MALQKAPRKWGVPWTQGRILEFFQSVSKRWEEWREILEFLGFSLTNLFGGENKATENKESLGAWLWSGWQLEEGAGWDVVGSGAHLRRWQCREPAWLCLCPLCAQGKGVPRMSLNLLLTQPTCSLLESSWNSRMKCFARTYWFVNTLDGQLSPLNVSVRSEFCSRSDLYLLIQQNWTVSQGPIDPVKISVSGWLWHFFSVR